MNINAPHVHNEYLWSSLFYALHIIASFVWYQTFLMIHTKIYNIHTITYHIYNHNADGYIYLRLCCFQQITQHFPKIVCPGLVLQTHWHAASQVVQLDSLSVTCITWLGLHRTKWNNILMSMCPLGKRLCSIMTDC